MHPREHLNLNVRGLGLSATVEIQERTARMLQEGRAVARLGLGQSPFPVPEPVVEELRANASQKAYLAVRGLEELRAAVAEYHRRRNGLGCSAGDVLVAPGSKELMFLLQVVFYGELVLPTPAWVSYAPQAQIVGRRVALLPCRPENGWRLLPEELDALCRADPGRPRVVVLNYPSNPSGTTYSSAELAELAEVARRYHVVVLSDEIYGELHYGGEHESIARHYPEGTIVSSGLSKWCGAGGWRLGTFTFPPSLRWLLDAMAAVASETYTSTSAPIQYAAVRAFRGGLEIERYLWLARRILAALAAECVAELRAAGADVVAPQGAFYLFADFAPLRALCAARRIATSPELARSLLDETGVALLPGAVFGRAPQELTLRLAFVDFDGAKAMAELESRPPGAAVDAAFLERHCRTILTALRRVRAWIAGDAAHCAPPSHASAGLAEGLVR
jgi:aspartate aminotransferase